MKNTTGFAVAITRFLESCSTAYTECSPRLIPATGTICSVVAVCIFPSKPEKDIYLYINTPGGSITAGLAIYDTMQYVKPDVATIALGQAASMGAVLLAGGAKTKRFSLPHSRVLMHQPLMSGLQGQATDIDIHAKDIMQLRKRINEILADHTGQEISKVNEDTERDFILEADAALDYGLIDKILVSRE